MLRNTAILSRFLHPKKFFNLVHYFSHPPSFNSTVPLRLPYVNESVLIFLHVKWATMPLLSLWIVNRCWYVNVGVHKRQCLAQTCVVLFATMVRFTSDVRWPESETLEKREHFLFFSALIILSGRHGNIIMDRRHHHHHSDAVCHAYGNILGSVSVQHLPLRPSSQKIISQATITFRLKRHRHKLIVSAVQDTHTHTERV